MTVPDESMAISKFKATCLAVLERVRKTGQPVRITRFGKPVADIVPPAPRVESESWVGALREHGRIAGDLIDPVVEPGEWEVLGSLPRRERAPRRNAAPTMAAKKTARKSTVRKGPRKR